MKNILSLVLTNIKGRKLRSYLTIIGIVIGVVAIVSLISLSQGLKQGVSDEFSKTGAQRITITSKLSVYGQATQHGLTLSDVKEIEKLSEVKFASGVVKENLEIRYNRIQGQRKINGYKKEHFSELLKQDGKELLKGKFIENETAKEIVIGNDFYENTKVFKKNVNIGDYIEIKNQKFRVVGILKDTGDKSLDQEIYMSFYNLKDLTKEKQENIDSLVVIIKDSEDMLKASEKIEKRLEKFRKENDFLVSTPIKEAKNREDALKVVSIVVIGIATISLLVGGIGILNSMYTAVLERRKEIGIMKAIGAKEKDILKIFLIEAGFIGLIGGIIGTVIGFLFAFIVKGIAFYNGITILVSINIYIILIALGFSFGLGLLAGFFPAYNASKHEAVDSLREE